MITEKSEGQKIITFKNLLSNEKFGKRNLDPFYNSNSKFGSLNDENEERKSDVNIFSE